MNKYQKALDRIVSTIIEEEADGYWQPRTAGDFCWESREILQELVDKADSFEWIPVSERLPEEYDYGTDQWNNTLWRVRSKEVLVSIEYVDGSRTVTTSFTKDGEWNIERKRVLHDIKVIAWMSLPKPYKENEND